MTTELTFRQQAELAQAKLGILVTPVNELPPLQHRLMVSCFWCAHPRKDHLFGTAACQGYFGDSCDCPSFWLRKVVPLRTVEEWRVLLNYGQMKDPDGWRLGDGVTLDTPIIESDFKARWAMSTTLLPS